MKRICVFCGSSPGARPEYVWAARELAAALTQKKIGLVYGGGQIGLMGEIATAVLQHGGEVIGVIPRNLAEKGLAFTGLPDLRIVGSMHERKALMADLSDGFIALPGGLGTIEEIFEALTWAQLSLHRKPCGLLNVGQYYSHLAAFLDLAVSQQFIKAEHRAMILMDENPAALLDKFEVYQPPVVDKAKWILEMKNKATADIGPF